jgi:hypothetical protein
MNKIIAAEDALGVAKDCIQCLFMAMDGLTPEENGPLQGVAGVASEKIDEAIALLGEYCNAGDAEGRSPTPGAPDATPKSPAARMKRTGK